MRLFAAFVVAALTFVATPTYAQSGWGMSEPVGGRVRELSPLSPTHRYWDACRSDDVQAAAHACGRVIGARISRLHTGSAHYFRAIALNALGNSEEALRDLRRAYGVFAQSLDADGNDANALYGRGLTLIRLGYPADGEADIARAIVISEGRAEQFFDASF